MDLGSLIVGGVTVTSTAAELNKLDGFTGDVNDLNYAKDLRATGVTTSEFDVLDGITATTAEINYVDGVTSNVQTQLNTKAPSSSPTLSSPTVGGTITITGGTQSWTVTASGTNLTFAYNNTNVLRVDSSGNLIALGDLTTNGTIS